jgi:hypothetical protein
MYCLWFQKPLNVQDPTVIKLVSIFEPCGQFNRGSVVVGIPSTLTMEYSLLPMAASPARVIDRWPDNSTRSIAGMGDSTGLLCHGTTAQDGTWPVRRANSFQSKVLSSSLQQDNGLGCGVCWMSRVMMSNSVRTTGQQDLLQLKLG